MVAKVIWSPQALTDLELIVAYVRQGGEIVARRIGAELISAAESLAAFPEKGRVFRHGDRPGIRELIQPPYRILYRHDTTRGMLRILRIWHGARGVPVIPAE